MYSGVLRDLIVVQKCHSSDDIFVTFSCRFAIMLLEWDVYIYTHSETQLSLPLEKCVSVLPHIFHLNARKYICVSASSTSPFIIVTEEIDVNDILLLVEKKRGTQSRAAPL